MGIPSSQLQQLIFEFKLNGLILFRGLFPPSLIDDMNAQFKELLALEMDMEDRGMAPSGRGRSRYAIRIDTYLDKIGGPLNDPRVRRNPLVEELATEILGPWEHGKLIVECPCKGSDYMGWHNDPLVPYTADLPEAKRPNQLKFHVPLVEVNDKNGPMEVIPGSHRMYYFEGDEAVKAIPALLSAPVLTAKGDAFLRDADLIHRGTPNTTEEPRPLYSQIFKSLRD